MTAFAPNAFSGAVDDLFADPNLARLAIWRAGGGGDGVAVRVIARRPDRVAEFGETRIHAETTTIDVRVAEASQVARGDLFEIDGDLYVVQGEPVRDAERLVWTVELRDA